MSVYAATLGSLNAPLVFPPRWYSQRYTPYVNEGEPISIGVWCLNPIEGAQVQVWFAGGNSLASGGNYEEDWHTVLGRACAAVGCTWTPSGGSPSPHGTVWGLITCGPTYNGETIIATVVTLRNRRTDANPIYGGPGYREMQLLLQSQAGVNGLTADQVGTVNTTVGDIPNRYEPDGTKNNVARNVIRLYDTSKRPAGSPTAQIALFAADGMSPLPENLQDGDEFVAAVLTTNMLPGTQIRCYEANDAQKETSFSTRNNLPAAAKAAGCDFSIITGADPQWYNGATIIYREGYSDDAPVRWRLKVKRPVNPNGNPPEQWDMIMQVRVEGTAVDIGTTVFRGNYDSKRANKRGDIVRNPSNGAQYVYYSDTGSTGLPPPNDDSLSNNQWRLYDPVQNLAGSKTRFFVDAQPRFYEILSARNDAKSTADFTFHGPINDPNGSVVISQAGTAALPGFVDALAAAVAATPNYAFDSSTNRLSCLSTSIYEPDLVWSVPLAASGKHIAALSDVIGSSPITIGETCTFMAQPALPADPANIYGVNVGDGSFAGAGDRYGTDYRYPAVPNDPDPRVRYEEFDYQFAKGARIVRLTFKWGRVQRVLFGDLYGTTWPGDVGVFPPGTAMDILRIDDLVANWLARDPNCIIILDMHNFAQYQGGQYIGYDQAVPIPAWIDAWIKLINRYGGNPGIWFDLMNEPNGPGQGASRCRENFQWLINAIRGRTETLNKILIEGQFYSSAQYWVQKGQAEAYDDFYDPAGNFAFSPHCYLDADASGTATECVIGSYYRLVDITNWARTNGHKLFLGEIGFTAASSCRAAGPQALQYIHDNKDVWIGFTAWCAGRRWGGESHYAYDLDPQNYLNPVDSGPMQILLPYLNI
jgi:endoglucanase